MLNFHKLDIKSSITKLINQPKNNQVKEKQVYLEVNFIINFQKLDIKSSITKLNNQPKKTLKLKNNIIV